MGKILFVSMSFIVEYITTQSWQVYGWVVFARWFLQITQKHENDFLFDSLVVANMMDYFLCKNGKDLVDQLRPIVSALDRCQSDCHHWQMHAMPGWASCRNLHSAPMRQLSTSDSTMPSRSSTSHVTPQVQRGEADNGAAARCEHMAC